MRGVLDLRLVGSFLLTICLSLWSYFSNKQKKRTTQFCASQEFRTAGQIRHGPLEGPEPDCPQFVAHPHCPLEMESCLRGTIDSH